MSGDTRREFDPRLLDLYLGQLAADEELVLRSELLTDRGLAEQDDALRRVFAALEAPREVSTPSALAERVVARVRAAGPVPRVVRPSDALTAAVERSGRPSVLRLTSLRDIISVAALIVLAVGVGVPGMIHLRERGQRVGCSTNLAQLGMGVQQYASTFNASLPFAGWSSHSSWQPTSEPGVVTVPNRRHAFLLLSRAYVADPRVFVCPGQRGVPMPSEAVARSDDFLQDDNVTYSYQNMAGVRPTANDDPALAIMADENPLFDDGIPIFDARRLPWAKVESANSRAHGGAGQNLLSLGGHVTWTTTPFAGVGGDNIWTLSDVTSYTGREGPDRATDSHLLK
ncbi:MAG: DUF1559 domain-containing protein [Phycisphaerales bacterium]|nr:DUF1559 domain-containing protein [Phycisphaerales bacterium]